MLWDVPHGNTAMKTSNVTVNAGMIGAMKRIAGIAHIISVNELSRRVGSRTLYDYFGLPVLLFFRVLALCFTSEGAIRLAPGNLLPECFSRPSPRIVC